MGGSSARKKKEKKKDFQKPKLRVGKTKPKADNFTDTSFKSKSIALNQQSLTTSAPSSEKQFAHYLSLTTSKSDTQRRDALAYLTTTLASYPVNIPLPISCAVILPKLLPLILDGSTSVRAQLLKLFRLLPSVDVADRAETSLLYIRAGMTHLATDIRDDALSVLEWLLETASQEAVSCPGGWVKTLNAFMSMMGWAAGKGTTKWTSAPKTIFGKGGKAFSRQLMVLSKFLQAGLGKAALEPQPFTRGQHFPLWDVGVHVIPKQSNPYAYLNLYGLPRDEEGEMYTSREARQRVFWRMFRPAVEKGVESATKEGGDTGRAAAFLRKVLNESLLEFGEILDL